jgi:hypothetical protein
MLIAYLALTVAHGEAWEVVTAMTTLGTGLGFGLGALANLVVGAVEPRQTGVATAMNTVMRTLGGAFGAALTAGCLAGGGGLNNRFELAFGLCAAALALGLFAAVAIPGRRSIPALTKWNGSARDATGGTGSEEVASPLVPVEDDAGPGSAQRAGAAAMVPTR